MCYVLCSYVRSFRLSVYGCVLFVYFPKKKESNEIRRAKTRVSCKTVLPSSVFLFCPYCLFPISVDSDSDSPLLHHSTRFYFSCSTGSCCLISTNRQIYDRGLFHCADGKEEVKFSLLALLTERRKKDTKFKYGIAQSWRMSLFDEMQLLKMSREKC
jgi:hypothetical protein